MDHNFLWIVAAGAVYWEMGRSKPASSVKPAEPFVAETWENMDKIEQIFQREPATDGDTLLHQHMQVVAGRSQEAVIHRSRYTSDNFAPMFQEELDDGEKRHWWEDDTLADKMVKDGDRYE